MWDTLMRISQRQKGHLQKTTPPITDHRDAEIEYASPVTGWVPQGQRAGVEIINIRTDDGQDIEDGEYLFVVTGDEGFFSLGHKIPLLKKGAQWTPR
jgi:hypothetical protein